MTVRKLMPTLGMGARRWHDALCPTRNLSVSILYLAFLLNAGQFSTFLQMKISSANTSQVITTLSYILGPVAQFHENSRFYSAVPPSPNPLVDTGGLPHVTIQMPVYKESLDKTM